MHGATIKITPALVLNPNAEFRNIFYRPVSIFWTSEMPAIVRRPPCCGFIYCSIPAAARLRSAVQSRVFSVTPPFFLPTHFDSYLSHGLFPSWMFIPFTVLFIIFQPPSPYASTTNHSLLVVVYWYPFFTFLIPTILLLFLFSHFVTPLLPSTNETVFVVQTAFLFGHRECFLSVLCGKKTRTSCDSHMN